MGNVIEIPDDGEIIAKLAGKEYPLDAFKIHNTLINLRNKVGEAEDASIADFHQAVADYLETQGLPKLFHFQVDRFVTAIQEAVANMGKAQTGEQTPCSPVSTGSTPPTSQAG